MKKKIFISLFVILIIAGIFIGKTPETNLLKSILPNSSSTLIKLSEKYSGTVNVVLESENYFDLQILKDKFLSEAESYLIEENDYQKLLEDYKKRPKNFLSDKTRQLLINKNYDTVFNNSQEALFNPFGVFLLPVNEDPMFLFSDFINGLAEKQSGYKNELNGKYYEVISLMQNLSEKEISKLVELQKKFSNGKNSIYLTGAPIHSYFTSLKSSEEINIIAFISAFFVLCITFLYFRNAKVIIPIVLSITAGIAAGYSLTAIIFKNVHILTFVFSTSLIGICVDYSLHYFVEEDKEKLNKSLKISLVTTVAAFLILLFSNIPLLCQIAIFTPAGLVTVYIIVLLFYDDLHLDLSRRKNILLFNFKYKKALAVVLLIIIAAGLSRVRFSDDVKLMYKPDNSLAKAEKILSELSLSKEKKFLLVTGSNIQDILQRQEKLKDNITSVSLSDFIPSISRQSENIKLVNELYLHKLYDCRHVISTENIMQLLSYKQADYLVPDFEKYPFLNIFMLDNNTSVMFTDVDVNSTDTKVKKVEISKDISVELAKHRKTCLTLAAFVFVILAVYLYYNYKKKAFVMVLPSCFGVAAGFSVLGFSLQPVNLFHIFSMFLILGFTLDYSIFRVSNIKKSKDAVFISCLTSAFSFFLLSFTSFKLISSLGLILCTGITAAYIFSLLLINNGAEDEMV